MFRGTLFCDTTLGINHMPLTDAACRNAKPGSKPYKLTDAGRLYLQVTPAGSKLWRWNYTFGGKQGTHSIGAYPTISLAVARSTRDRLKEGLVKGIDPSKKQTTSEDRKFKNVARAWFEARRKSWSEAYASRVWSRVEDDALPALGEKDVAEIEPGEVLDMLREIEARNALEMAKRVRQYVSGIFRYAVAEGKTKIDPAASLADAMQRRPRQKHHAALRDGDLPQFFVKLRAYDGERQTAVAIEFVAHAFPRTQEFRFAEWTEFGEDVWRIPEERMKMKKEHLVPLSPRSKNLLAELKELSNGSKWVVPGEDFNKPISENTLLFALYRMGYHKRATIHGLRSTASTILNESRLWWPDAIERQLAHVPEDEVRSAYNAALYLDQRIEMMNWYSKYLLAKDGDLSALLG